MKIFSRSMFLLFIIILIAANADAGNHVAIIIKGYEKDCTVKTKDGEKLSCKGNRELYEGDEVKKTTGIKSLEIKKHPGAVLKEVDKNTLQIEFNPQGYGKGSLQIIKEFLGFMDARHGTYFGATKGFAGDYYTFRQPFDGATMLSGIKTIFAWENDKAEYIVFINSKGEEVFKKAVKGTNSIKFTPEKIGMRPSEVYSWNVDGAVGRKIRLLRDELSGKVNAGLAEIEKEKTGDMEEKINKAAYFQLVSDSSPKDIDLYWLSCDILNDLSDGYALDRNYGAVIEELKINCMEHAKD